MTYHRKVSSRIAILLTILATAPGAFAQWATSGNNIQNTNSGNVGIGGAPSDKLHVFGGFARIGASNSFSLRLDTNAIDALNNGVSAALFLNHAGTGNILLDGGGKIGIGTATPGALVHIFGGPATAGEQLRIEALGTDAPGFTLKANGQYLFQFVGFPLSGVVGFYTGPGANALGFAQTASGNVGIGTTTPTMKLDVNGNANITGNLSVSGNIAAKYQDVAEWVPTSQDIPAGTVVILDESRTNHVLPSNGAYDTRVAGIVSDKPGVILGEAAANRVMVATTGRVRVHVDATNGPIHVGDLLVTSDREGVAMVSQPVDIGGMKFHRPGTIVGKALEPLPSGSGDILVLLTLQ